MSDKEQIGRLAMRQEGGYWTAYYAFKHTMDNAILLGSIRMNLILRNAERKQAFMDMMRGCVSDIIEKETCVKCDWGGVATAPEHERSGRA